MGSDYFLVNYTKKQYIFMGHKSLDFERNPLEYIKKILEFKWEVNDKIRIRSEYEMENLKEDKSFTRVIVFVN